MNRERRVFRLGVAGDGRRGRRRRGAVAGGGLLGRRWLRAVLEAKNDALLERKGAELVAVAPRKKAGRREELESETAARWRPTRPRGWSLVVRCPAGSWIARRTAEARLLAGRTGATIGCQASQTLQPGQPPGVTWNHRLLHGVPRGAGIAAGNSAVAGRDRGDPGRVRPERGRRGARIPGAGGGRGPGLSNQALRPVARSIPTPGGGPGPPVRPAPPTESATSSTN